MIVDEAVLRESEVEDAVDGVVQMVWDEAGKLEGQTTALAELIARRVGQRFGFDV